MVSNGPRARPRRETLICSYSVKLSRLMGPSKIGWSLRAMPTKPLVNSCCSLMSGAKARRALMYRSMRPACRASFSVAPSPSGTKRSTVCGACTASRSRSLPPYAPTNTSLAHRLKVRSSVRKSTSRPDVKMACACSTTPRTCSRNSSARGVGARPRPERTKTGSPMASRMRARVRLMAGALRCMRRAAATALPSSSRISRATSRFRSGSFMRRL